MNVIVEYKTKYNSADKIMHSQIISCQEIIGHIEQGERRFVVQLEGDEKRVIDILRNIWELAFLYDGYFYEPKKYIVNGNDKNIKDLYFLSYYKTGNIWRSAASTLAGANKDFSEERLLQYTEFRNMGRATGKLITSLINAFYYLHSEAYENINVNHRLSLLLNMCDGFVNNTIGPTKNVQSNIAKIIGTSLDSKSVKYGVTLLGIPANKMYEALAQERHEIDHYIIKDGSITEFEMNSSSEMKEYIYWYFTYVIELALRIFVLKQVGYDRESKYIEYAMNEINDWVILECGLAEECKNQHNKMKQSMRRCGIK